MKAKFYLLLLVFAFAVPAPGDTTTKNGITWTYVKAGNNATIGNGSSAAIDITTPGAITVPETLNTYTVTNIAAKAFCNCTQLTGVTIPGSVKGIGNNAFEGCTSLVEVAIPDSVKRLGNNAFEGCTNLVEVAVPGSVKRIGVLTFYNCKSLTNVTLAAGVTNIAQQAFTSCEHLRGIYLPPSVTTIGTYVFSDCKALEVVLAPYTLSAEMKVRLAAYHPLYYGAAGSEADIIVEDDGTFVAPDAATSRKILLAKPDAIVRSLRDEGLILIIR